MQLPTVSCRIAWQMAQLREEIAALAACFSSSAEIQSIANEAIPCRLTLEVLMDIYFRLVNAALCEISSGGTVSCLRPDPNCDYFTVHLGTLGDGAGTYGSLNIYDPWAKGLLFDDLIYCAGSMIFTQKGDDTPYGMPFLTFISAPLLVTVDGDIFTAFSIALIDVSFPLLETVGGDLIVGSSQNQETLDIHSLRTVGGNLDVGGILATSVDMDALETVGGDAQFGATATISLPSLTEVGGGISLGLGPTTTTVSIPSLAVLGGNFDAHGSALNVASVNHIFEILDAITPALTGITIDLSGGTSATPTGAGLAAATNLDILNTVSYNP